MSTLQIISNIRQIRLTHITEFALDMILMIAVTAGAISTIM